jgi:hypothetical protein
MISIFGFLLSNLLVINSNLYIGNSLVAFFCIYSNISFFTLIFFKFSSKYVLFNKETLFNKFNLLSTVVVKV